MHQNDDNLFGHVPRHNVLSTQEMNELVYPEFHFGTGKEDMADIAVEAVDEFIARMFDTYEPYDEEIWQVSDTEMFCDRGIYFNEYDYRDYDSMLDCDEMNDIVNNLIGNMRG